jgi:sugar lactone lactonase YvrE
MASDSPDNSLMYHNDSSGQTTYCYDFDLKAGTINNQRVFWSAGDHGYPDGLTVGGHTTRT